MDDAAWLAGALAGAAKLPAHKKSLLAERASLLELVGRYSEAGVAWEQAATAMPGIADARLLLSAAACRLASGDAEEAGRLASALGFLSPEPYVASLGTIVAGWSALYRGDEAAAAAAAKASAGHQDAGIAAAAALLGRASTEGAERAEYVRRLSIFASRPEASSTAPSFLFAGLAIDRSSLAPVIGPAAPPAAAPGASTDTMYYQVGAFRDEANAKALSAKLLALGLRPTVKLKPGKEVFAVYVEAGKDPSKVVLVLKDSGYEAWAVEGAP